MTKTRNVQADVNGKILILKAKFPKTLILKNVNRPAFIQSSQTGNEPVFTIPSTVATRWVSGSDPDPEHALTQLQAEQSTVGHAKSGTGRFGEVGGQHGLGAVPRPGAAAELADVVEAGSCAHKHKDTGRSTVKSSPLGPLQSAVVFLTRVQVPHHVDVGSDGHGGVNKG